MNIDSQQQSLLTFRVGPVLCCAPSLPVRSIITPPKLTRPPGSEPSHPGIFKHGSHIVKVLDLRQKFGIETSAQTQPGNLIITIFEKENFAFWVDQILDVFDFPEKGWGNLPAAIPRGVFSRTLLLNKKIHLYSEFEKLATINELGYLKSYLQQLSKQDTTPDTKKINTDKTTDKDKEKSTLKPSLLIKKSEEKKTASLKNDSRPQNNEPKPKITSKSSAQYSSLKETTKTDYKIKKKHSINKIILAKEIPQPSVTTNLTLKSNPTPLSKKEYVYKKEKDASHEHLENEESSNIGVIIFLVFLFISSGFGIYYYFLEQVTNKYKKEKHVNNAKLILNIEDVQEESFENSLLWNNNESRQEEEHEGKFITPDNSKTVYRADITQRDNEITIIVHQPETKIIPQQIHEESKNENILKTAKVEILKQNKLNKIIAQKDIINEIIHTVVKGDTLWAIAKKYVNDPFLYPELARLSKIKNPHRIYPGNRVRIRFIKN